MSSTEDAVRDFLVDALEAIAQSKLGFDETNGNIKDYPIEFENDEDRPAYLMAPVGGKKKARCWSVDVRGDDTIFAQGGVTLRNYLIVLSGYYGLDKDGESYKALISHARKIREKIKSYGVQLNNLVDTIRDGTPLSIDYLGSDEDGNRIIKGSFTYTAQKQNPAF